MTLSRKLLCTALAATLASASALTLAPTPQALAQSTPPDIVRLKSGGMYRGTIAESDPNSHTTIVLITGEQKRFEADEIEYAGPSKPSDSGAGLGARTTDDSARKARFRFESAPGQTLTLHMRTRSAYTVGSTGDGSIATAYSVEHQRLCTAPCEGTLPPGQHLLAVSRDDYGPVPVAGLVDVRNGTRLEATYTDNSAYRWTGAILGGLALIGGSVLMLQPIYDMDDSPDASFDATPLYVGGGIMLGGVVVSTILTSISDSATIEAR